jgi:hypothetical protein
MVPHLPEYNCNVNRGCDVQNDVCLLVQGFGGFDCGWGWGVLSHVSESRRGAPIFCGWDAAQSGGLLGAQGFYGVDSGGAGGGDG